MPADASEIAGDAAKERAHAVLHKQLTRCCGDEVFQNQPSTTVYPIAMPSAASTGTMPIILPMALAWGTLRRDSALPNAPMGPGLHGAAERHLADDAGEAKQHHEEEVGDEKCRAAKLRYAVGEQPDAGQADGRTDARDDKGGA